MVSELPSGLKESYIVKFWFTNAEGLYRQTEETFYADSKSAHEEVEAFAKKNLAKFYKNFRIISVTYM